MNQSVRNLESLHSCKTAIEILRKRSYLQPDVDAFTFLEDGETATATLTYRELDLHSRAIAAQLQALNLRGERALLLYPPGLDYIAAFFGCLYAGVIAVPAYPPRNQRNTPRIQAIISDAQAAIALTTSTVQSQIQSLLADKVGLNHLRWLTTDTINPNLESDWQEPFLDEDAIAFLQYTSGSTGTPKGVILTHGNLLHNAAMTYRLMGHSLSSKFVSWLPTYHDMGLIGGILQPLYGGFSCILMPPSAFLARPYRWLKAISDYQGTTSGAPNFAYQLCIEKITSEQLETLDFSSWSVAFNGAEPIRANILEEFCAKFARCGFRPEAFYPCYGMAESTLMISGGFNANPPVFKTICGDALEKNRVVEASVSSKDARTLVGCGQSLPEQQIIIVNRETLTRCQANEVGEIWVSGASVGKGYWHRFEETQETFSACLSTGEGAFLRTGDLGFLDNGEVFITGRAKDLIIIRGRNLYPQDIELTVECSHPSLRSGGGAAFSVEVENEERLVVVQELEFRAKPNLEEVISAIRQAITREYEVQVYGVVLIKPGSIPKTSSGKIQRRATRSEFLTNRLNIIASSIINTTESEESITRLNRQTLLSLPSLECQTVLESYLQELVAQVLKIAPSQINPQQNIIALGLDSLKVFELKNRLETDLEIVVPITDFFEDLSIQELATKIFAQLLTADSISSLPFTQISNNTDTHPLSFTQTRLWFLEQLEPGNPAYNIIFAVRLQGNLDRNLLEKSLNEIVKRHESLRTTFKTAEGQPIQIIAPSLTIHLPIIDLQKCDCTERELTLQQLAKQESQQPFNLSQLPLWRAKLLHLESQEHILLLTIHHIIADEWSVEVLLYDLAAFYQAALTKKLPSLPELPIQYKNYTDWQRQYLTEEILATQLSYWKKQLEGAPAILQLPTDRPRSPVQTYRGAQQSLKLPKPLTQGLQTLARQEGVTLFMLLLAAFKTLLYRYTGQEDISIGSPIANRNRDEFKKLIGFFVNTLVLRTNLEGNPSFRELLNRVRQVALEAYTHQDLPFDKLVEAIQPVRDVSHTPLFQVSFTLRTPPQLKEMSGVNLSPIKIESCTAQFDLSLVVEFNDESAITSFEYNTDLFDATTIARMLGHWQNLLEAIIANPQAKLSELSLLSETEKQQILVDWNDTKVDYPQDLCIHQLIEAQVERTPDAIALVFENLHLTYRELNNKANQLARYLQSLGIKPDVIVGICMERSLEMVITILAILKAGGAYLPLDPTYPKERLAFMMADAQVSVLLTQSHLVETLPSSQQTQVICLDLDTPNLTPHQNQNNPVSEVNTSNIAYVIYTSGSTGTPKGVLNTHLGLSNRLLWMQDEYNLTASDRVLQKTPFSFDVSVWEFLWSLFTGSSLVLASPEGHRDSAYLVDLIATEQITTLHFVPSMLQVFLEEPQLEKCHSLKQVFCSGEALSLTLQERFFARINAEFHNLYGPTEAAIDVTYWRCQCNSDRLFVPIGRAIANTQIYILDRYLQPVPIGVAGELHIGGLGLARGYLNRTELTEEKFIANPFKQGERLYKTGDLARYHRDGTIEYLGRIDHQIKLRGFRIELGEIEAVLSQHPAVREVIVMARGETFEDKQLVAYLVSDGSLTTNELRNYLKEFLPEYAIPSAFVWLNNLPLLPNGKVNRGALPMPENLRPTLTEIYQAPSSEIERAIANIWQEVLNIEKVGINDNFFDLGGHSLLMVQVNHKLNAALNRNLSVVEMFQNPTIYTLARYLTQKSEQKPAFESVRDRVQKRIQVLNRQKQLNNN
ncbi:MAG: amino acid adenylation domain-containing protein [Hydrococcus sp. Prado102]|jgi:amino acid adenylation domain-containing protein|nr:amino acid adenylation domain-containing protein [Hydrococcus sp. Prado102]